MILGSAAEKLIRAYTFVGLWCAPPPSRSTACFHRFFRLPRSFVRPQVASELGRLLRPLKGMCHVNIIPLNPTAGYKGGPSMADAVNQFVEVLARNGVPATPR